MDLPSVTNSPYGDEPAIVLRAAPYEAWVLPGIGGHVVALRDRASGLGLLREPLDETSGDLTAYRLDPIPYGIPLLFPPNRIEDGTFTAAGVTYRFPINEPKLHNRLHGLFAHARWDVAERGSNDGEAVLRLRHSLREADEEFAWFPHLLTLELDYRLSRQGLAWTVRVTNDGHGPMPLLLGFHTALRTPTGADGEAERCELSMNIGDKWELSPRKLPTGRTIARDDMEEAIASGHGNPYAHAIDALFSAVPVGGPNVCRLRLPTLGLDVVYETDPKFRAWMLWNRDAKSHFFCPEPMTCLVNAPNLDLPWQLSGMQLLPEGASFTASSRLKAVPVRP